MNPIDAPPVDAPIQVYADGEGYYYIGDQAYIRDDLFNELDGSALDEALQFQDAVEIETATRLQTAYNWVKDVPTLMMQTMTLHEFVEHMHQVYSTEMRECPDCQGDGYGPYTTAFPLQPCETCKGQGIVTLETETEWLAGNGGHNA